MAEITHKFIDVLSEKQIADLSRRCKYYDDEFVKGFYINPNDFINGYSIIEYGYNENSKYEECITNVIDTNGEFIEIKLNENIKYTNGSIVKLNNFDDATYTFEVHRILELDYIYKPFKGYVVKSSGETAFFYIKVIRNSSKENEIDRDMYFVINPDLKVIATFIDANTWDNEYDGYDNCNVYNERKFFFINKEREYLVFSQKLMAFSYDPGFFEEHMYGIDPDLCEDQMREAGIFDDGDPNYNKLYECDLDDDILNKIIGKHNDDVEEGEEDEEDDKIPDIEDITFFYEDQTNNCYKNVFNEYYKELFGIIDCKTLAKDQLLPFTDNINYVIHIIWDRWRCEKDIRENGYYSYYSAGWSDNNKRFYGYVMSQKFFDYPSVVKGVTLKYVLKYYPKIIKRLIEHEIIIIPNALLNDLENNELTRYIRITQEKHLDYSPINSVDDTIVSDEKYGIVSTYQGQTLRQVIYSKGGTKHLVSLIKHTNLHIDKNVLENLINSATNKKEKNCYNIIQSVMGDLEFQEEEYNDWVRQKMDEDMIREANRLFDDMMNDYEAWGNID